MLSADRVEVAGMAASLIRSHRTCDFSVADAVPYFAVSCPLSALKTRSASMSVDAGRVDQLAPHHLAEPGRVAHHDGIYIKLGMRLRDMRRIERGRRPSCGESGPATALEIAPAHPLPQPERRRLRVHRRRRRRPRRIAQDQARRLSSILHHGSALHDPGYPLGDGDIGERVARHRHQVGQPSRLDDAAILDTRAPGRHTVLHPEAPRSAPGPAGRGWRTRARSGRAGRRRHRCRTRSSRPP